MKAIQSLEREKTVESLHYSSAITVSESDFVRIKSILIKNIEEIKAIIKDSPAEGVFSFNLDLFRIEK
jgi:hypothetical protein